MARLSRLFRAIVCAVAATMALVPSTSAFAASGTPALVRAQAPAQLSATTVRVPGNFVQVRVRSNADRILVRYRANGVTANWLGRVVAGATLVTLPRATVAVHVRALTSNRVVGTAFRSVPVASWAVAPSPVRNLDVVDFALNTQLAYWDPPASNGGPVVSEYRLRVLSGDGKSVIQGWTRVAKDDDETHRIVGLPGPLPYLVQVVAVNWAGVSSPATAPFAASDNGHGPPPPAPTEVQGFASETNAAIVMWSWSANGGGWEVDHYTATASPGGKSCTASRHDDHCQVTGLAGGTPYTFTVTASTAMTTASSTSAPSAASAPLTVLNQVPLNVSHLDAKAGNSAIAVTWASANGPGRPAAVRYTATARPGGRSCTVTFQEFESTMAGLHFWDWWWNGQLLQSDCTLTNLSNGTAYTVTVVAQNAAGASTGVTSAAVIPGATPVPPTDVVTATSDTTAAIAWVVPDPNGIPGRQPATSYTATATPGGRQCTVNPVPLAVVESGGRLGCAISGLSRNTSHTISVVAGNSHGSSTPVQVSAATGATPATTVNIGPAAPVDGTVNPADRDTVRSAWIKSVAEGQVVSGSTSDTASCTPGTTTAAYQKAVTDRINWYRNMVGLPDVRIDPDPTYTRRAQAAALIMDANNDLSHGPPQSWKCWSNDGARGAGSGNLSLGYVDHISGYINDGGDNNRAVGHRRWILFPELGTVAVGTAGRANSLVVFTPRVARPTTPTAVPWPSAGFFPKGALPGDEHRWSLSAPQVDFATATVSITGPNGLVPARVVDADPYYGDSSIVFEVPSVTDATVTQQTTFTVHVNNATVGGTLRNYTYQVTVFP